MKHRIRVVFMAIAIAVTAVAAFYLAISITTSELDSSYDDQRVIDLNNSAETTTEENDSLWDRVRKGSSDDEDRKPANTDKSDDSVKDSSKKASE